MTKIKLFSSESLKNSPFFEVLLFQELPLEGNPGFYIKKKENPFEDTFPDPLCKLNLKETSDFVKALPMAPRNSMESIAVLEGSSVQRREGGGSSVVGQRRLEAPSTPGRPVFSFSGGSHSRKSFPSKWDDAEKWLISSSCHESPAHVMRAQEASRIIKQNDAIQQKADIFAEKCRVTEEKVSGFGVGFNGSLSLESSNSAFHGASSEVLLKGGILSLKRFFPTLSFFFFNPNFAFVSRNMSSAQNCLISSFSFFWCGGLCSLIV